MLNCTGNRVLYPIVSQYGLCPPSISSSSESPSSPSPPARRASPPPTIEQNDTAAESLGGAQTGDTGGEAGSGGDDDGEAGDGQDNAAEATTSATDDATAADGSGPGVAVVLLAVTGTVLASRRRQ